MSVPHTFDLHIPGNPVPKGRPRVYRGHGVTPKRTRDAEQRIRNLFRRQVPDGILYPSERLLVRMDFWLNKTGRPDLDNIMKLCLDALNGLAYADDEQIEAVWARRYMPDRRVPAKRGGTRWRRAGDSYTFLGEPYEPHTHIHIEPLNTQQPTIQEETS